MSHLYVCHFSNGHIKVGRSIDPMARIATHAERVSCVGIELVEHAIFECAGLDAPAEAQLIRKCKDAAIAVNKNEWFVGLDFNDVVAWANAAALGVIESSKTTWSKIIRDLQRTGVTQQQVADVCGCRQWTISDLATGKTKDPSFPLGTALIDLHTKYAREISAVTHQAA